MIENKLIKLCDYTNIKNLDFVFFDQENYELINVVFIRAPGRSIFFDKYRKNRIDPGSSFYTKNERNCLTIFGI